MLINKVVVEAICLFRIVTCLLIFCEWSFLLNRYYILS